MKIIQNVLSICFWLKRSCSIGDQVRMIMGNVRKQKLFPQPTHAKKESDVGS